VLVLVEVVVAVLVEVTVDVTVGPEVIRQEHAEEMTLAAVTVADAPKAPLYLYTVAVVARLLNGLLVKVDIVTYEVGVGAVLVTMRVAVLQIVSTRKSLQGFISAYTVEVTTTSTVDGIRVVVATALVETVEVAVTVVVVVFFRNEEQKDFKFGFLRKALASGHDGALVMQVACFVMVAALASRTAADARGKRTTRSEEICILE
jgi:hypothetical protein